MIRFALIACLLVGFGAEAGAFEQPPIQSPQDQACRAEAKAKVFEAPDPDNLGLHAIGRRLYLVCMQRAQAVQQGPVKSARRPRRV